MSIGTIMQKLNWLPVIHDFILNHATHIYLLVIMYIVYYLQLYGQEEYKECLKNKYYVYIAMEAPFFFFWILSSILFLLFIHLSKFRGFCATNEEFMSMDNIWEMKNSTDILHYLDDDLNAWNMALTNIFCGINFMFEDKKWYIKEDILLGFLFIIRITLLI